MEGFIKSALITSGSDFHAYDWFVAMKKIQNVDVLLDCEVSGGSKNYFEKESYQLLLGMNGLISRNYGKYNDKARNIIKLCSLPLIVYQLSKERRYKIYWAHGLFFGLCLALTRHRFVLTPQGSELLVRPKRSIYYRKVARWIIRKSAHVTVDSEQMAKVARDFGGKVQIIQNGVDLTLLSITEVLKKDNYIVSPRGFTSLYRIEEILREVTRLDGCNITMCYPFEDLGYSEELKCRYTSVIKDLGRLNSKDYLSLLGRTRFVVSVPRSDSSPKSIYEAIFLGCIIITNSDSKWLENCTELMKSRIITVDINEKGWLKKALEVGDHLPEKFKIDYNTRQKFSREENIKILIKLMEDDMQ